MHILLYTKQTRTYCIAYGTIFNIYNGKESEKERIYMYMHIYTHTHTYIYLHVYLYITESLRCTPEANTTSSSYTSIE